MKYLLRINRLFLITVVLPTLLAVIYFSLIASDIFISESQFVVRSPQKQSDTTLGVLLKGTGIVNSQDDAYTIQNYLESRDALESLEKNFHIKEIYSSASHDILSRFPGLDWNNSFENFLLYYQQKVVTVAFDSSSGIVTLDTRAFTEEDAHRINEHLLELSEALVNRLNDRIRRDLIQFAMQDVSDAKTKAEASALALRDFRNKNGVIDPEKEAEIPLENIAKLKDDLFITRMEITQVEQLARRSPLLPSLRLRAKNIEGAIREESTMVASRNGRSLATKVSEYERLSLDREFADKLFASTMVTLEEARNEARRQELYIERIAQPSLPDHAMEPRRARSVLAVLVLGLVMFGVLTMLIAGIKEHQD